MKKIGVFWSLCMLFSFSVWGQVLGYKEEGGNIRFVLLVSDCETVTDDMGEIRKISEISIQSVNIAADWNDWKKDLPAFSMQKVSSGEYQLLLEKSSLGQGLRYFKFVINGIYWVEPPMKATNKVPVSGGDKRYQNWFINLPKIKENQALPKEHYEMDITIENIAEGTPVALTSNNKLLHEDLLHNGKISWKGSVNTSIFAEIKVAGYENMLNIVLENKKYTVKTSAKNGKLSSPNIKGSLLSEHSIEYFDNMAKYGNAQSALYEQRTQIWMTGDTMKAKELDPLIAQKNIEMNQYFEKFILSHTDSYFSLLLINRFLTVFLPEDIQRMFGSLNAKVSETELGKETAVLVKNRWVPKLGDDIKPFSLPDSSSKMIEIANFKGNWIVLDFWASWCGPCRGNIPNLKKLHQTYKDKKVVLIGISADDNREAWVSTIQKEQTTWLQLSDLKGINSNVINSYGINAFPTYLVINPEGKIVYITSNDMAGLNAFIASLHL